MAFATMLLPAATAYASSSTVTVQGYKTTWRASLLKVGRMDRIPHVNWVSYKFHFYSFVVLTLRLTNTGSKTENPYTDLGLVLKVLPPRQTKYLSGFAPLNQDEKVFIDMAHSAAKIYGGAVPWQATQPGQTRIYCVVFGIARSEWHFGLYNVLFAKPAVFMFNTGY